MTELVQGKIDPYRLIEGIAASGYTPQSAICDIVDNSVTWGASRVTILLDKISGFGENRAGNANRYVIADNGKGMDAEGLGNALALGSRDLYPEHALSKFGLGLKSAAFSQGKKLTVLTKKSGSLGLRAIVDLEKIKQSGEYCYSLEEISEIMDEESWSQNLPDADTGTIVIIEDIRKEGHPAVKKTSQILESELGRTYQYFMTRSEDSLTIAINGKEIKPFDPLFISEANENERAWPAISSSPLVRGDWDGKSVEWLQKPVTLVLDPQSGVTASLEITQLPHPPSMGDERLATRDKYKIGAGEYGVYVYRNDRLISSKSEYLDGIIPQDQELYGLRARLKLSETADTVCNIDLKKSRILLSTAATHALEDALMDPKRQSKQAWKRRTQKNSELTGQDAESQIGDLLSVVELPTDLATDSISAEEESIREKRRAEDRNSHSVSIQKNNRGSSGGSASQQVNSRVIFVDALDDNDVWERAYSPTEGTVVKVNGGHRFIREIRERTHDRIVTFVLQSLLLSLANGEAYTFSNTTQLNEADIDLVLENFRHAVSASLGQITQTVADSLDL